MPGEDGADRLGDAGRRQRGLPRVDIPAEVTGVAADIQDMRLPGMLHARAVR